MLAVVVVLAALFFFSPWLPKEFVPGVEDSGGPCLRKTVATGYWVPFGRMFTTCRGDTFFHVFWGGEFKLFEGDGQGRHLNT